MAVPFPITIAPSRASFAEPATGLRFHQVMDDYCAPVIAKFEYVLLAPVTRWAGEGYYLIEDHFGEALSYHCTSAGTVENPKVRIAPRNDLYRESYIISHADFCERVLGKVAMTCRTLDAKLLQKN